MPVRLCPACGWPITAGWFDDARHGIVVGGEFRAVPATPWTLLSFFRRFPGQVMPTERIYDALYAGRENPPAGNTLRVHICKLRRLLAGTPFVIVSRSSAWAGSGYLFDLAPA